MEIWVKFFNSGNGTTEYDERKCRIQEGTLVVESCGMPVCSVESPFLGNPLFCEHGQDGWTCDLD